MLVSSAALSKHIHWEAVDSVSAKATMSYGGITYLVYFFNNDGDMLSFEADRYYVANKKYDIGKMAHQLQSYYSI
jgi:hypothetical protein